ncbi:MAG: SMEK domain-containing protein [Candidatus Cloacimonetes bacterium]|nr:SMEK domain-containing protein [Candidatus Cloacimonadota bacterium]
MTEKHKLEEIIALITFLQNYIQNNVKQSFTDLTFSLETVIKDYLNVFERDSHKYENINFLKHNYPAIDLVSNDRNIAIQITTNADLRKVKKTVLTYNSHKFSYEKLIVIGFVKATKSSLPNITIYSSDYLIKLAKNASSKQKDELFDLLKRQIPWNSLSPLDDKLCYDIVFDVINRSAIRDLTICEGDFNRMVDGLYEIKEIITTGKIKGKPIRAKALVEYSDEIKSQLSEIEFLVSNIIQICNANKNQRNSHFICLTRQEKEKNDELKEKIITKANELARQFGLNKRIYGSRRW